MINNGDNEMHLPPKRRRPRRFFVSTVPFQHMFIKYGLQNRYQWKCIDVSCDKLCLCK